MVGDDGWVGWLVGMVGWEWLGGKVVEWYIKNLLQMLVMNK